MSVTRSASLSVSQVLNSITTAATALTTTFNSIGDASNVMSAHSQRWLHDTRIKIAAEAVGREQQIIDEVVNDMALRASERATQLNTNATLKAAYDTILPTVQNAVNAALGRPATSNSQS